MNNHWKYHPSVPNELLQNDIGEDVSRILGNYRRQSNLLNGYKRDEIVSYVIDSKRAFNYSRQPKKYIPYNIPKDAYDLFFYNYGFQVKDI